MRIVAWETLAAEATVPEPFLIDPYIPERGVVLLHGRKSLGKSPISWAIASSIAAGTPFFGCKSKPGKVLYIEADTPEIMVRKRISHLETQPNFWWAFKFY